MAAATMMSALSGSSVAGASFGASPSQALQKQQNRVLRLSNTTTSKVVAVRASSNDEGRISSKAPQMMLVTLAAAGAALALTVSPAHAGLFGGDDAKVERGAAVPEFPGNEGTGNKVGDNSSVRNAASSGTPANNTVANASAAVADAVETGIDVNIDPLKTKISDINPFKDTLNPLKSSD